MGCGSNGPSGATSPATNGSIVGKWSLPCTDISKMGKEWQTGKAEFTADNKTKSEITTYSDSACSKKSKWAHY